MGTTPTYALPYPEGGDLVIAGDDAIQALAERLETLLTPAYGHLAAVVAGQAGVTSAIPCTFDTITGTGQFSYEPGNPAIRYTGPSRWFHVDIELIATGAGGVSSTAIATLNQEGVTVGSDRRTLLIGGGGSAAFSSTLRVSTTCLLHNGHALQMFVDGGGGGATFTDKRVRITSIGAPQ